MAATTPPTPPSLVVALRPRREPVSAAPRTTDPREGTATILSRSTTGRFGELYHLSPRADNPLTHGQAQAALAAALLRWLHVIITQRVPWSEQTASGPGAELPTAA